MIVASGPSAKEAPLDIARGKRRFIAINESWRLCPWADVLYACDGAWWRHHAGLPEFSGLKTTQEARAAGDFGLRLVKVNRSSNFLMLDDVGSVGDGGNSGFQALNLAIQFGAARILLVGYDMNLSRGEHWHGPHPQGLNNPREHNIHRWLAANWTAPIGVEVVNCNPDSALMAYPKMKFEAACNLF